MANKHEKQRDFHKKMTEWKENLKEEENSSQKCTSFSYSVVRTDYKVDRENNDQNGEER